MLEKFVKEGSLHDFPPTLGIAGLPTSELEKQAKLFLHPFFCQSKDDPSYRWLQQENHPDCQLIRPQEGSQFIRVDQARRLREEAAKPPYLAPYRFFLLIPAHALNIEAANALLKILEEPPVATHFLLLTPQPRLLLPTIRSRVPFIFLIAQKEAPLPLSEGLRSCLASYVTHPNASTLLQMANLLAQEPWHQLPALLLQCYKETQETAFQEASYRVARLQAETRATFNAKMILEGILLDCADV